MELLLTRLCESPIKESVDAMTRRLVAGCVMATNWGLVVEEARKGIDVRGLAEVSA